MTTCRTSGPRPFILAAMFVASVLGVPRSARAQAPVRFELGGRLEWFGGSTLGDRSATLTPNTDRFADPFVLFTTRGRQDATPGGGVTLALRLTNRLSVEGSFLVGRPALEIIIPNDVEGLAEITVTGRLSEYLFEAGLVADLASGAKWRVFAMGGAGYLRQVHDERSLVDTGRVFHAGGGVRYWFRKSPARRLKGAGLRAQARLLVRDEGFSLGGQTRTAVNLGAGLFTEF